MPLSRSLRNSMRRHLRIRLHTAQDREKAVADRLAHKYKCSRARILSASLSILEYLSERGRVSIDGEGVETELEHDIAFSLSYSGESRIQEIVTKSRNIRERDD